MAQDDRKCLLCNGNYKFCLNSNKYDRTETWRNLYCSENCRELYFLYDKMKSGKIERKEAVRNIKAFDTTKLSAFNEPMKSVLTSLVNEILKPTPRKKKAKENN